MKWKLASFALAMGLSCAIGANSAPVTVDLGQSTGNLTLYGQGQLGGAPAGVGSYTIGQGTGSFDAGTNTSTFTFTGAITGGPSPFTGGTYDFVTTYSGNDAPQAGPNAPKGQANPSDTEFFFYDSFDPSTQMFVTLTNGPDMLTIPLVTNGVFDGPDFGFGYTTATCSGVATCDQALVGLTPGSDITGPVDISVTFDSSLLAAVPEPSTWALLIAGVGGIGAALRLGRKVAPLAAPT